MKRSLVLIFKMAIVTLAILPCARLNAQDAADGWINISDLTSFTVAPRQQVLAPIGIWNYFQENNITTGSPFPGNGVFNAYGLNPGNCARVYLPTGTICSNYRFQIVGVIPATPSNDPGIFYLTDLNALSYQDIYHIKDDPKGTSYGQPALALDNTPLIELFALITAEPTPAMADQLGTPGWFSVLAGGGAAIKPGGGYMKFILRYNPRADDPQSFTLGGDKAPLSSVFTAIAIGNQFEPVQVTGISGGVYHK